jgi:hypothetical protein
MTKSVCRITASFVFTVAIAIGVVTTANAVPAWEIDRVVYDPAGTDTGSNTHLNQEVVVILNNRSTTADLKGYTVRDAQGHVYTFTSSTKVLPGQHLLLHTGSGTNSTYHRYWGRSWYVWNNTGDTATLRNPAGTRVDSCTWPDGSGTTNC